MFISYRMNHRTLRQGDRQSALRVNGRAPRASRVMWISGVLTAAILLAPRPALSQAGASQAAAGKQDPTAVVKSVINSAAAVVKESTLTKAERNRKLRAIAEEHFDFVDMARTSLGYHWRSLTPQQRQKFVPLFTRFMEAVYLSKMQDYSMQKLRRDVSTSNVTFTGQELNGPDYAQVHTAVALKDKAQPIKVDYLLKREGSGWKIYDLDIDAISVMANYRNQFNRVINDDGYPKLISMLEQKQKQLDTLIDK